MSNLVVDIGNTRIKSAVFKGKKLLAEDTFSSLELAVKEWNRHSYAQVLISSVRYSEEELKKKLPFPFHFLSSNSLLPISNGYATPHTLGLDRIAAAVGAWSRAGKGPVLAVDLGTCVTYDVVNEHGVFLGGVISPGMEMRAKAMNSFTARLPLVDLRTKPESFVGDTTVSCLQSGVWFGLEYELLGHIEAFGLKFPEIRVFICGGDAHSFVSLAKDHIFVVPNLVLHGLNCILNHNVE
ncbi:type III pantothenate kinase [Algoriphagus confluentis]|uniref:Type III pantothenate kinase n=1 Tax=Algoriphagus confluentis TaxID=1697556 RepID=A0ABQ6PS08_9BACT|nr:type III pantothenate kinase [Algoriphagus confluentis]